MSNAVRWRLLLVVVVLAGAVALSLSRPVRLGLDLQGGTQIVLEAQDTDRVQVDGDVASRTLEVLRRRVDALGVAEPTLQRSGDRRIIIELPGVADPDEAVRVVGRTAQLAFHPVLGAGEIPPEGETPEGEESADQATVLTDEDGLPIRVGPAALTGDAVSTARASIPDSLGAAWVVEIDFRGEGGRQWEELTGEAACAAPGDPRRRVAIVLDRDVITSPQVNPGIACGAGIGGGSTVITGTFTQDEAQDLALLIRAGALPVPVEIVEQRTIGPTLGDAAIRASVQAAVIGAALTILYMIAYYRLFGVLAAVALLIYGLLSYAVLLALNATLTLPGIAGFVLAIGMAVDANVLVFERAKEERASGRSVRASAVAGFQRAWSAIADSNATTVLAAILLFFYASGAVRGFGITLTVGVAVSMFTALVVTRLLVELVVARRAMAERPALLGFDVGGKLRVWLAERGPDIIGRSRVWFAISAIALLLAVTGIATQGLSYGLEFSGGRLLEYDTDQQVDLDEVRAEMAEAGFPRAVVQESGDGNVAIRTVQLTADEEEAVEAVVTSLGGGVSKVRDEFVGPTIGDELRRRAAIALGLALTAQLIYLAVRFRWTYGTAAVAAMFQDVTILLGIFAWLGKDLDGVFLAALLTVIGYSINDSVVVFDRIREQHGARSREPLATVANDACLQTLPRTINTGLGALFILVALYFLGGETLTDFALALLIGVVVGTYSSVFTAAPIAVAAARIAGDGSGGTSTATAAPPAPPQRVTAPVGAAPRPRSPQPQTPIAPRPRKSKRRKGPR